MYHKTFEWEILIIISFHQLTTIKSHMKMFLAFNLVRINNCTISELEINKNCVENYEHCIYILNSLNANRFDLDDSVLKQCITSIIKKNFNLKKNIGKQIGVN